MEKECMYIVNDNGIVIKIPKMDLFRLDDFVERTMDMNPSHSILDIHKAISKHVRS